MRALALLLVLSAAQAHAAPEVIMRPEDLPPFVDPLVLSGAVDLPEGDAWIDEEKGGFCYDSHLQERMLLTLNSIEPASDLRATQAFHAGFVLGFEHSANTAADVAEPRSWTKNLIWLAVGASSALLVVELLR